MTDFHRHEYRAYLWTLGALVLVYFGTITATAIAPGLIDKIEAFGLGTITGGLIGLLRMPRQSPHNEATIDLAPKDESP